MLPALYLYPLNDSFIPKHISLAGGQRVKIGRQTNAKTVPAERNGYFDSKVLSRQHAEVWEDGGKIFIKDVKSSNGTFINSDRLSPEGLESEPYELKTDDIVEFGIDIVGEDNKTIIHHKVAARVVCVFTEQDVAQAARAEHAQQSAAALAGHSGQAGPSGAGGGAFSFAGAQSQQGTQRRPAVQPQGLGGMGGMGGGMRPPGKSGLTFDHIISRLQGELQKSRETGAELHGLTGAMNDIHDTLGGTLPQNLPPYPSNLPPVRQQQPAASEASASNSPSGGSSSSSPALSELQAQLQETQASLAGHVDKIRALDTVLAEHEAIKREVSILRETVEERKRTASPPDGHEFMPRGQPSDDAESSGFDDDDARSIATITPHELERVDEEDEEQLAAEDEEDERRRRRDELGRPRTPEPSGLGMLSDDERNARRKSSPPPDELAERLATLSAQLESALELSRALQAQHAQAQDTIAALETKVSALEGRVAATQAAVAGVPAASEWAREREGLAEMVGEWRKNVEGKWAGVQEEWEAERERLKRARDEWERRAKKTETEVEDALGRLERVEALGRLPNGDVKDIGLVTPPSPRSLSSDSTRPRRNRRRSTSSRGRSTRSLSKDITILENGNGHANGHANGNGHVVTASESSNSSDASTGTPSFTDSPKRARAPWKEEDDEIIHPLGSAPQYPLTPKPSFDDQSPTSHLPPLAKQFQPPDNHMMQYSTAVGMLMLSAAAAAVIYRVKPDLTI